MGVAAGQPLPAAEVPVARWLGALGAAVAVLVALAIPVAYCGTAVHHQRLALQLETRWRAHQVEELVAARPELWAYETVRLTGLIGGPALSGEEEERVLRDAAGQEVARTPVTVSSPALSFTAPFFDSGRLAGRLEARRGLASVVAWTTLLALAGLAAGAFVYRVYRTVPLRMLAEAAARRASDEARHAELEEELRQAQKMEVIGTFSGGIAHDVNNLLTPIIVHAGLAMEDLPEASEARENLQEVVAAARRASDLVRQILLFGRKEARERRPLHPGPVVAQALRLLRASLPATIAIRPEIDEACGPVYADETRLHQVVLNLCANARDALAGRGGTIAVAVQPAPGGQVRLSVADDGPGIAPELLGRIFDPYFTTKPRGSGTGLGLSVVHGIVQALGGAISVRSTPAHGATFEVLLPVCAETAASTEPEEDAARWPGKQERVLLVDDEPAIVRAAERTLRGLGYRVTALESSAQALEALQADPSAYDLVVTDQTMPAPTGLELLRAAKALRPGLPVILCTGHSEVLDAEKARLEGAAALIGKPYTPATLARALRAALDGPKPR